MSFWVLFFFLVKTISAKWLVFVQSLSKPKQAEEDDSTAGVNAGKGLKAMLNGLEELWDQSQYNEEYNLDQFVARLSG